MPDTIEKRVAVLEEMVWSIPETLEVHWSRIARNFAEVKETQALHTQRLGLIERRLEAHDRRFDSHDRRFDSLEAKLDALPRALAEMLATQQK